MQTRTSAERIAITTGIALVVFGSLLLLGRFGELVPWSITQMMHRTASLIWPITLVAAGALLLANSRSGRGAQGTATASAGGRVVRRSRSDRVVTGLLGGVAEYLGVPAGVVRVGFVLITLMAGVAWGVLVYVVGSLLVSDLPSEAGAGSATVR